MHIVEKIPSHTPKGKIDRNNTPSLEEYFQEQQRKIELYQDLKALRDYFTNKSNELNTKAMNGMSRVNASPLVGERLEDMLERINRESLQRNAQINRERGEQEALARIVDYHMDPLRKHLVNTNGTTVKEKYHHVHPIKDHLELAEKHLPKLLHFWGAAINNLNEQLERLSKMNQLTSTVEAELIGVHRRFNALQFVLQKEGISPTTKPVESIQSASPHLEWTVNTNGTFELPEFNEFPAGTTLVMTSRSGNEYAITAAAHQGPYRWMITSKKGPVSQRGEPFMIIPGKDERTGEPILQIRTATGSEQGALRNMAKIELKRDHSPAPSDTRKTRIGF